MKNLTAFIFVVSLAGAAQAQVDAGYKQPVESIQGETNAPPPQAKPAQPSEEKPAQPSEEKSAQPSKIKPAQPSEEKPAQPSEEKPAQPGVITERVNSTPEILQAPETPFFRPFHNTTAQPGIPEQLEKFITTDKKSGLKRLHTVPEFKKLHSAEIKALRQSLRKRPNSEIRKAVAAREAAQKDELKALQDAILTEAEKNQEGALQPLPENRIIQNKKAQ